MKKAAGPGLEVDGVGAYAKPVGLAANQGAVYATAGSSGKATNWWGGSTALINPNPHPVMVSSLLKLGSMVLDFNHHRLDVRFLTSTGAIEDQFTIAKTAPNIRPTVAITTPSTDSALDAPVTVAASADDVDGTITRVDFYAGRTHIGSSTNRVDGSFRFVWAGASPGPHALTAEAWDNLGTYTVSAPVNITVNLPPNEAPTVSMMSPAEVYTAPVTVVLSGTAADSDGTIVSVSLYDSTTHIGFAAYGAGSWTFSWSPSPGTYQLSAVALDDRGATAVSPVYVTTINPEPIPAAPAEVVAVAGDAQVTLNWTASTGATGYNVKRSATGTGPFVAVAEGLSTTSFINTGLVNGTTYYYVVTATGTSGPSPDSPVVSATPTAPAVLKAPSSLTAKAASSTQVNLTWSEASINEQGFKIERSLSSSSSTFTEIGIVGPNVRTWQELGGLKPNTTYYYRVRAYAGTAHSGYSNTRSVKTLR